MENVELVGIAYEIGECNDEEYLCIDIYEVWLQKENIEFKLTKKWWISKVNCKSTNKRESADFNW